MKLFLPPSLRAALLAAFSLSSTSIAEEIHLPGTTPPADLDNDTIFILDSNVSYDASSGTVFYNSNGYGMTFQSSEGNSFNLAFNSSDNSSLPAISTNGSLSFENLADISFIGGNASILMPKDTEDPVFNLIFNNSGNIEFSDIQSDEGAIFFSYCTSLYPDSSLSLNGSIVFNNGGNILFSSNESSIGGSIFLDNYLSISANSNITVNNNLIFNNGGNVSFSGNESDQSGGAITFFSRRDIDTETIAVINGDMIFDHNGHVEFLDNQAQGYGGAIYVENVLNMEDDATVTLQGNILFNNNGNVLFNGNESDLSGGAIYMENEFHAQSDSTISFESSIVFNNNGTVDFSNNSANFGGGAIYLHNCSNIENGSISTFNGNIVFNNKGDVKFSDNLSDYEPGAGIYLGQCIFTGEGGTSTTNGNIVFNNKGNVEFSNNSSLSNGGGIFLNQCSDTENGATATLNNNVVFNNEGNVLFSNNSACCGAAIFLEHCAFVEEGGTSTTNSNIIFNNKGNIEFSNNIAQDNGGAIGSFGNLGTDANANADMSNLILFEGTGNILFSNNKADALGGAIFVECSIDNWDMAQEEAGFASVIGGVSIKNINGDVLFEDNSASWNGGAIYLKADNYNLPIPMRSIPMRSIPVPSGGNNSLLQNSLLLSADGGNITFKGNTSTFDWLWDWDSETETQTKILNSVYLSGNAAFIDELRAAEGKSITFYDPIVAEDDSQEILHINKTTDGREYKGEVVFSGEFVDQYITKNDLESDADFQERITQSLSSTIKQDAALHNGTLHITEKASLRTSSMVVDHAELKTTNEGIFRASTVSMNSALMDIKYIFSNNSPLVLDTRILSGNIAAWDKNGDLYSAGGPLNQDRSFAILTVEAQDALISTLSTTMEYDRSDNPYGVQGKWSLVWDDPELADLYQGFNDPDHILYATWVKTGFLVDPEKERDSKATLNALWTSKSNMDTMTRAAMGQIDAFRFLSEKDSRYWAMALGDFSSQGAKGLVDGYDYWGGGYSMGADTKVGRNCIAGFGFGQIFGSHQGRSYRTKIDQETFMGMLYASHLKQLNERNALRYDVSFGYGLTSNTMKSYDNYGEYARGKWDNKTLGATFRFNWDYALSDKWLMTSFVGLEYTSGHEEGFTESGRDPRHFDRTDLRNLSMPVGVNFTYNTTFSGGQVWTNSLELSYVPDVYRENPGCLVHFAGDDTRWYAAGINPARNAGRAEWSSRFHFNKKWAMFASYQIDFRDRGCYQSANIGLSVGF